MTSLEKIKFLKQLYRYRALGIEYITECKQTDVKEIDSLPNSLENLKKKVLNCHLCELSKNRKNIVFGEGDPKAKIMFIGEGPGASEDDTGRPFVGRAGELLTKIIENVLELKREEVYIANIVKCRPPNNRVPTENEAQTCLPYLFKQIEIIDPKIIVALGATSYRYLSADLKASISRARGEVMDFMGAKLIPTFHPSFLLRNPAAKKDVYQDMLKVKGML